MVGGMLRAMVQRLLMPTTFGNLEPQTRRTFVAVQVAWLQRSSTADELRRLHTAGGYGVTL